MMGRLPLIFICLCHCILETQEAIDVKFPGILVQNSLAYAKLQHNFANINGSGYEYYHWNTTRTIKDNLKWQSIIGNSNTTNDNSSLDHSVRSVNEQKDNDSPRGKYKRLHTTHEKNMARALAKIIHTVKHAYLSSNISDDNSSMEDQRGLSSKNKQPYERKKDRKRPSNNSTMLPLTLKANVDVGKIKTDINSTDTIDFNRTSNQSYENRTSEMVGSNRTLDAGDSGNKKNVSQEIVAKNASDIAQRNMSSPTTKTQGERANISDAINGNSTAIVHNNRSKDHEVKDKGKVSKFLRQTQHEKPLASSYDARSSDNDMPVPILINADNSMPIPILINNDKPIIRPNDGDQTLPGNVVMDDEQIIRDLIRKVMRPLTNDRTLSRQVIRSMDGDETLPRKVIRPLDGDQTLQRKVVRPFDGDQTLQRKVIRPMDGDQTLPREVIRPMDGDQTLPREVARPMDGDQTLVLVNDDEALPMPALINAPEKSPKLILINNNDKLPDPTLIHKDKKVVPPVSLDRGASMPPSAHSKEKKVHVISENGKSKIRPTFSRDRKQKRPAYPTVMYKRKSAPVLVTRPTRQSTVPRLIPVSYQKSRSKNALMTPHSRKTTTSKVVSRPDKSPDGVINPQVPVYPPWLQKQIKQLSKGSFSDFGKLIPISPPWMMRTKPPYKTGPPSGTTDGKHEESSTTAPSTPGDPQGKVPRRPPSGTKQRSRHDSKLATKRKMSNKNPFLKNGKIKRKTNGPPISMQVANEKKPVRVVVKAEGANKKKDEQSSPVDKTKISANPVAQPEKSPKNPYLQYQMETGHIKWTLPIIINNDLTIPTTIPRQSVSKIPHKISEGHIGLMNTCSCRSEIAKIRELVDHERTLRKNMEGVLEKFISDVYQLKAITAYLNSTAKKTNGAVMSKKIETPIIAFTAKVGYHLTNLNPHDTVVFDRIITNDGGGYNPHTGHFTAPVSGTYQFFATILSGFNTKVETAIIANGEEIARMYAGAHDAHGSGSNSAILHLSKGDDVLIRVLYQSGNYVHGFYSTFSGYLLRALEEQ